MDNNRSCCCGALPPVWWWLLTLLGLPLLYFMMINARQGDIETDLAARSAAGLKVAGMNWAKVSLTGRGRDVLLEGVAASEAERDKAIKLAQGIYGVRDVQSLINVSARSATPAVPVPATASVQANAPAAPVMPVAPAAPVASTSPVAPVTPVAPATPPVVAVNKSEPVPAQVPPVANTKPAPSAEEKAVQNCQQQLNDAMKGKTILFETNKAVIRQDSVALLDSLVGIVSTCKSVIAGRGIQISGHTDNVGNDAYNQKLSEQRAGAVKNYFVQKGMDTALVNSVGYGESRPVASNDNEAGRSQNRRITFDINPE